jgi:hypothetical protein
MAIGIPIAFAKSALGAAAKKAAGRAALKQAAGTAATTLGITGMNQLLQDRAFRKEKQWWKEQFDYAAKYDTPAAQMKRMKEAGLNPALMYGGQGSVAGAPSPSGGSMGAAQGELSSLSLMSAEAQNLKAELGIKRAQEGYLTQQSLTEMQRGRLTGSQADVAEGLVQTNMDLQKYQLQLRKEQLISQQIDNYVKDQTKNQQVQMATMDLTMKLSQIENLDQDLKNKKAQVLLTEAQTKLENLGLNKSVQSAILLAITKMFNLEGEKPAKKKTIDDKIAEEKEKGNFYRAKQLENQKKHKAKRDPQLRRFGKRADYGPKL